MSKCIPITWCLSYFECREKIEPIVDEKLKIIAPYVGLIGESEWKIAIFDRFRSIFT